MDLTALDSQAINKEDVAEAIAQFDALWEVLYPLERVRIVWLLVERVSFDARAGEIPIDRYPVHINELE